MKIYNKNQITKQNLRDNIELKVKSVDCIGSKTTVCLGLTEDNKIVYMVKEYFDYNLQDYSEYRTISELKKSIKKIEHY